MTNDIADDKKVPEFIAEYIVELRRLATHCEFHDYLNDALQGIWATEPKYSKETKDHHTLMKALEIDTLMKALEIAQGMEAAEANMKKLQSSELA